MSKLRDQLSRLVYSTDQGRLCPDCGKPQQHCECKDTAAAQVLGNGRVVIRRETKGRKGKGVTLIEGLAMTATELETVCRNIKTRCGCGGSVKGAVIEIQGDQRQVIQDWLATQGIKAKMAGG